LKILLIDTATFLGSNIVITGTSRGHCNVEFILTNISILSEKGGHAITGNLLFAATTPLSALLRPATVLQTILNLSFSYLLIIFNTYNVFLWADATADTYSKFSFFNASSNCKTWTLSDTLPDKIITKELNFGELMATDEIEL